MRIPSPSGVSVNTNGTRKAGSVYFHVSIIVVKGIAAGERRGGKRRQRRRRADLREHRVVEDEHVRRDVRHAGLTSAGATMTAAMMYDAVTGTARPSIHTASAE